MAVKDFDMRAAGSWLLSASYATFERLSVKVSVLVSVFHAVQLSDIGKMMSFEWNFRILTKILTIQAGYFDLEACFYTNKMSIPFGTRQKLTIQAG